MRAIVLGGSVGSLGGENFCRDGEGVRADAGTLSRARVSDAGT